MDDSGNDKEGDRALRRYDVVLRYLAADTQVYWIRSQFFLITNAALLSSEIGNFPPSDVTTPKLLALFLGSIVGLILCVLWFRSIDVGRAWMEHWKAALRKWEPSAFGDVNLFRERPAQLPKPSHIPKNTAILFLLLWIAATLYLIFRLFLRISGCGLTSP
jgi:hypothetical protein